VDSEIERSAQTSSRARRTGILGAVLLLIGYALPLHGSVRGVWESLLLGPVGGGLHIPLHSRIFTPLWPVGVVGVLLFASIARGDPSMNILGAGVMIGAGVAEGLFFTRLLGDGLITNLAVWIGFLGSVVVLVTGVNVWRERSLQT